MEIRVYFVACVGTQQQDLRRPSAQFPDFSFGQSRRGDFAPLRDESHAHFDRAWCLLSALSRAHWQGQGHHRHRPQTCAARLPRAIREFALQRPRRRCLPATPPFPRTQITAPTRTTARLPPRRSNYRRGAKCCFVEEEGKNAFANASGLLTKRIC